MRAVTRMMVVAVAGALTLGCGGDDSPTGPGGLTLGTFTGSFSGDLTGSASGSAFANSDENVFVVMLMTPDQNRVIQFANYDGFRRAPGTYTAGVDGVADFSATLAVNQDAANGFFSTGGSVTITSSTASAVAGTFNVTFKNFEETETINFTGSFKASCPATCP